MLEETGQRPTKKEKTMTKKVNRKTNTYKTSINKDGTWSCSVNGKESVTDAEDEEEAVSCAAMWIADAIALEDDPDIAHLGCNSYPNCDINGCF